MSENPARTRCGFAAIIGLPNAGKSTLLNTIVGTKVSIVSRKVQTTRTRVLGIALHEDAQIILIDTPGVFAPKKPLEKAMVKTAWQAVPEADVILHLVDVTDKNFLESNQDILKKMPSSMPCILVLNKVDKVKKSDLLKVSEVLNLEHDYDATFMISALSGAGTQDLLQRVSQRMPAGPFLFEEDQVTDMPMRIMAAEITREKIFDRLHQELPYAIMTYTENWAEQDNGSVQINQVILVQRDSQKGIVLGKGGATIKEIGTQARAELEDILDQRVRLNLFVKVQKDWDRRAENYALMGLSV